jgi:hypothetical protein
MRKGRCAQGEMLQGYGACRSRGVAKGRSASSAAAPLGVFQGPAK